MKSVLGNKRKKQITSSRLGKYLLYAIGEIILIIIGILIAVNINNYQEKKKNNTLKCAYLDELKTTIGHDKDDAISNREAIEKWNPKLIDLAMGIYENKLSETDSLNAKFGTVGNYVYFVQKSISKIEELKYSNIELIENRTLKNEILSYQNEQITALRHKEKQYETLTEDIRQYYLKNFAGFNYGNARPHDLNKIKNDKLYFALLRERIGKNGNLKNQYERLEKKQEEIIGMIGKELEESCQ